MHGFISKGVLCFVRDVHGDELYQTVIDTVGVDLQSPDLYLKADTTLPWRAMGVVSDVLGRSPDDLLDDFGTYLISHENTSALRRLMRFSGQDFEDFLAGLPDLKPRVAMAIPGLELPRIDVENYTSGASVRVFPGLDGYPQVIAGVIRAMADDYGALVQVQLDPAADGFWMAQVVIIDSGFGTGRNFDLLVVQQ
ncbi:MAG: heme NO-binding domain-containing protein [Pseudomonadota bacterium]